MVAFVIVFFKRGKVFNYNVTIHNGLGLGLQLPKVKGRCLNLGTLITEEYKWAGLKGNTIEYIQTGQSRFRFKICVYSYFISSQSICNSDCDCLVHDKEQIFLCFLVTEAIFLEDYTYTIGCKDCFFLKIWSFRRYCLLNDSDSGMTAEQAFIVYIKQMITTGRLPELCQQRKPLVDKLIFDTTRTQSLWDKWKANQRTLKYNFFQF